MARVKFASSIFGWRAKLGSANKFTCRRQRRRVLRCRVGSCQLTSEQTSRQTKCLFCFPQTADAAPVTAERNVSQCLKYNAQCWLASNNFGLCVELQMLTVFESCNFRRLNIQDSAQSVACNIQSSRPAEPNPYSFAVTLLRRATGEQLANNSRTTSEQLANNCKCGFESRVGARLMVDATIGG